MSRMRVSMGVLPTKRTKKSCSMTEDDTVRSEGSRSSSLPKRLGWLGYWLLTYSSSAHCDFSWRLSMWAASDRPQASARAATARRDQGRGTRLGQPPARSQTTRHSFFFFLIRSKGVKKKKKTQIGGKRKILPVAPYSFFPISFPSAPKTNKNINQTPPSLGEPKRGAHTCRHTLSSSFVFPLSPLD